MTTTEHPKPLRPRHERFVAEYLTDCNATQAYIRAGYRRRSAQANASTLLKQPHIAAAVTAGRQRIAQSLQITAERLAQELARIAFANVDDYISVDPDGRVRIDLAKADRAKRAGLLDLSVDERDEDRPQRVKIRLGKLQALTTLTRHLDVFAAKAPEIDPVLAFSQARRLHMAEQVAAHRFEAMREAQAALAAAEAKLAAAGLSETAPAQAQAAPARSVAPDEPVSRSGVPAETAQPRSPQNANDAMEPAGRVAPAEPPAAPLTDAELEGLLRRGELCSAEAMKYLLRRR